MSEVKPNPNLLDVEAAAGYLHLSVNYLAKLRCWGGGPVFLKLGRRVLYRKVDLDDWIDAQARRSTSDRGAA